MHRHRWTTEVSTARPAVVAHAGSHGGPEQAVTTRTWCGNPLPLTPKQRAVLVLRYYEDLSEAEIAAVLQIAPGTVKSHAHAALLALSTHLPDGHGSAHRAGADMNLEADVRAALPTTRGLDDHASALDAMLDQGERHRRRRVARRLGGVAALLPWCCRDRPDRSGPRRRATLTCHRRGTDRQPAIGPADVRPTLPTPRQRTRIPRPRAPTSAPSPRCEPAPCTSRCPAPQSSGCSHQGRSKVIVSRARTRSASPQGLVLGSDARRRRPSQPRPGCLVERVGRRAGQVVVVEASTGDRLATTKLEHPLPRPVIITSIDEHVVHFAAPDVEDGPSVNAVDVFEPRGDQFWTWPWPTTRHPTPSGADEGSRTSVGTSGPSATARSSASRTPQASPCHRFTPRTATGPSCAPDSARTGVLVRPGLRGGRQHPHRRDARAREPSLAGTAGSCHPEDQVRTSWAGPDRRRWRSACPEGTGSTAMPKQVPAHLLQPRAVSCTAMSGCCRPTEVSALRAEPVKRCSTSAGVVPPRLRHGGASVTTVKRCQRGRGASSVRHRHRLTANGRATLVRGPVRLPGNRRILVSVGDDPVPDRGLVDAVGQVRQPTAQHGVPAKAVTAHVHRHDRVAVAPQDRRARVTAAGATVPGRRHGGGDEPCLVEQPVVAPLPGAYRATANSALPVMFVRRPVADECALEAVADMREALLDLPVAVDDR